MTKAEIDAKWVPLHNKVSQAYYALSPDKQKAACPLFQKWHTQLSASWELEYIANGILSDEMILGQDERGEDIKVPVTPMWLNVLKASPTLQERQALSNYLAVEI